MEEKENEESNNNKIKVKSMSYEFQQIYIDWKKKQQEKVEKKKTNYEKTNDFLLEKNKFLISSSTNDEIFYLNTESKVNENEESNEDKRVNMLSNILEEKINYALKKTNSKKIKKNIKLILERLSEDPENKYQIETEVIKNKIQEISKEIKMNKILNTYEPPKKISNTTKNVKSASNINHEAKTNIAKTTLKLPQLKNDNTKKTNIIKGDKKYYFISNKFSLNKIRTNNRLSTLNKVNEEHEELEDNSDNEIEFVYKDELDINHKRSIKVKSIDTFILNKINKNMPINMLKRQKTVNLNKKEFELIEQIELANDLEENRLKRKIMKNNMESLLKTKEKHKFKNKMENVYFNMIKNDETLSPVTIQNKNLKGLPNEEFKDKKFYSEIEGKYINFQLNKGNKNLTDQNSKMEEKTRNVKFIKQISPSNNQSTVENLKTDNSNGYISPKKNINFKLMEKELINEKTVPSTISKSNFDNKTNESHKKISRVEIFNEIQKFYEYSNKENKLFIDKSGKLEKEKYEIKSKICFFESSY